MSRATLIPSVTELALTDIDVTEDRLRDVDSAAVGAITQSIAEHGLLQPLIVRRVKTRFQLVDGAHRKAALRMSRQDRAPVRCYEGPVSAIRLIEIDANLASADLSDLDRAVFLAERRKVYLEEHPETKQGAAGALARWDASPETGPAYPSPVDVNGGLAFYRHAARQLGLDAKRVQKLIQVGGQLDRTTVQRLRTAPQKTTLNDLLALAKARPEDRPAAVDAFSAGEVKKLAAALKSPGTKPVKDPIEEAFQKLRDAWSRAPATARRRFVAQESAILLSELRDLDGEL